MNTFQRNFVFAISVLLSAGILVTGSLTAYSIYRESKTRAEQALIRKRVDRVRGMNLCAELTGDERARLDAQANDPDGTKPDGLGLLILPELFAAADALRAKLREVKA